MLRPRTGHVHTVRVESYEHTVDDDCRGTETQMVKRWVVATEAEEEESSSSEESGDEEEQEIQGEVDASGDEVNTIAIVSEQELRPKLPEFTSQQIIGVYERNITTAPANTKTRNYEISILCLSRDHMLP